MVLKSGGGLSGSVAVDWQALEGIGGLATAVAVVIAIVFGVQQLRETKGQRLQAAATATIANWLDPAFIAGFDRLLALPDDADPETIRRDEALRHAVLKVDFAIEGVGVLVFERAVGLHAADHWMGGVVRTGWRKVRRYVEAERTRLGSASVGEWWQWLADRMEEDPAPGKREGAHVAFRTWRR